MEKVKMENTLRERRFYKGEMSQQALADLADCTRQTIIALEQNKYLPSLLLAFKLASIFECTVEDLFKISFD